LLKYYLTDFILKEIHSENNDNLDEIKLFLNPYSLNLLLHMLECDVLEVLKRKQQEVLSKSIKELTHSFR